MQKVPNFGERGWEADQNKDTEAMQKLRKFLTTTSYKPKHQSQGQLINGDLIQIINDKAGILKQFGARHNGGNYIFIEEAVYLLDRKLLQLNETVQDLILNSNLPLSHFSAYNLYRKLQFVPFRAHQQAHITRLLHINEDVPNSRTQTNIFFNLYPQGQFSKRAIPAHGKYIMSVKDINDNIEEGAYSVTITESCKVIEHLSITEWSESPKYYQLIIQYSFQPSLFMRLVFLQLLLVDIGSFDTCTDALERCRCTMACLTYGSLRSNSQSFLLSYETQHEMHEKKLKLRRSYTQGFLEFCSFDIFLYGYVGKQKIKAGIAQFFALVL